LVILSEWKLRCNLEASCCDAFQSEGGPAHISYLGPEHNSKMARANIYFHEYHVATKVLGYGILKEQLTLRSLR
jgi:hypothetical protein